MRGRLRTLLVLGALASTACGEREEPPPTGALLYARHCAACHGTGGTGDGPLAEELVTAPADLTRLSERGDGQFDEGEVMAAIDGRRAIGAHGTREMPVWGLEFEARLHGEPQARYTAMLQVRALTDYLRSLQHTRAAGAAD